MDLGLPIDAHVHPYQVHRDARGPEEFAKAAFEKGLGGLVFTEHAPLWYSEPRLHFMTESELERCIQLQRMGCEYHPERHEEDFREIFAEMEKRGMALEWNASGFRRDFAEALPCDLVWRWSLDYNLPRTYGSDAHKPEDVGAFIDRFKEDVENVDAVFRGLNYNQ